MRIIFNDLLKIAYYFGPLDELNKMRDKLRKSGVSIDFCRTKNILIAYY